MKFKKLVGCILFCAAFTFPNALAAPPNVSNINDVFAYIADKVRDFDLKNFNDEKANNLTDIIDGTILKKHKAPEIGFVKFNDLASEYWKLFDKDNGNCRVAAICLSDLLTKANVENYVIDFYCQDCENSKMDNSKAHSVNIFKASDGNWKILDFYYILTEQRQSHSQQYESHSQQYESHSQQYESHSQQYESHSQQYESHSQQYESHSQQYDCDNIKKGDAAVAYDDYLKMRVNLYGDSYSHAAAIRNFETFREDGDYDIGEFMKIKGYNFGDSELSLFFVTNFENFSLPSQKNSSQQKLGGCGTGIFVPRRFVDTVCKFLSPNKSNPMDLRAIAKANNMTPSKYIVSAVNDYNKHRNQV